MANKETYFLREFKKGDYMLWNVCSQCWQTFTVTIRDDSKVYTTIKKTTHNCTIQKLEQNAEFYGGGSNLRVEIVFDDSKVEVKESSVTGGITDRHTNTVGYSYTYCIEDGTDDDYNDAYIAIIAWRNAN